jgi:hypothetical protein
MLIFIGRVNFRALQPVRLAYQPPASSTFFCINKPATSNQPTVLFSQNKSAPAISHQPNEQTVDFSLSVDFPHMVVLEHFASAFRVQTVCRVPCIYYLRNNLTPADSQPVRLAGG